jgi:hypothetical protein
MNISLYLHTSLYIYFTTDDLISVCLITVGPWVGSPNAGVGRKLGTAGSGSTVGTTVGAGVGSTVGTTVGAGVGRTIIHMYMCTYVCIRIYIYIYTYIYMYIYI